MLDTVNRKNKILSEAKHALQAIEPQRKQQLAYVFPLLLASAMSNRADSLGKTLSGVSSGLVNEVKSFASAIKNQRIKDHTKDIFFRLSHSSKDTYSTVSKTTQSIYYAIRNNPNEKLPALIAGVLGFYFGSGGLDGDGGFPDLDLALGIEDHRSLWTHSIFMGSLVEASVLTAVVLSMQLHKSLPSEHDPIWDKLNMGDWKIIEPLLVGTSAGLAYHFGIDATVDGGGTYAAIDGVPLEVHQTIMAMNAVAEGANAGKFSMSHVFKVMNKKKMIGILSILGLGAIGLTW